MFVHRLWHRFARDASALLLACLLVVLAGGAVAIASLALSSTGASAAVGPTTPTAVTSTTIPKPVLTLVGPATETINLRSVGREANQYEGAVDVLIQNAGPAVGTAKLSIVGDPTAQGNHAFLLGTPKFLRVPGYQLASQLVVVKTTNAAENNVTIVLSVLDPPGVAPTSETFKLLRSPSNWHILWPIIIAIAYGVLSFFGFGLLLLRVLRKQAVQTPFLRLCRRRLVYPPSTWTFGGSWVTLISGFSGILVTVLGTTGLIASAFPSVDMTPFIVLNLAFSGVSLLGPLVYAGLSTTIVDKAHGYPPRSLRPHDAPPPGIYGRAFGLLCAASLALVGIVGQLATMAALAYLSKAHGPELILMILGLAAAAVVLFWYGYSSLQQIVLLPQPPKSAAPATSKSFMTAI